MIKLITPALIICLGFCAKAETKAEIVRNIHTEADRVGIDPDIAVAIATVESGLNPNAVGSLGEIGVFQLRPEYHNVKAGNASHNTRIALQYLRSLRERFEPTFGKAWFVPYNCGPNRAPKRPSETTYYKRVMREFGKIKVQRYLVAY